jgi:hypothetical protein
MRLVVDDSIADVAPRLKSHKFSPLEMSQRAK